MNHNDLFFNEEFFCLKKQVEKYNSNQFYHKSIKELQKYRIKLKKDSGVYYLLSLTYLKNKDYLKGVNYFKYGVRYDEKNTYKYLSLIGNCLFYMNDIENAYSYSHKAYLENKRDIDALIILSKIELQKNDYEESFFYILKALDIDNTNYEAIRTLSKIYISMGINEQEVLDILQEAKKYGKDEDLAIDIIKFLYLNEKYIECLRECKSVIKNCENGYIIEKTNKYVSNIYNIINKDTGKSKKIYSTNSLAKISSEISNYIESGKLIKNNDFKDLYENHKQDFLSEIKVEMMKVNFL